MNTNFKKIDIAANEAQERDAESALIEELRSLMPWSDFAMSLVAQYDRKCTLSEKQWAWVNKLITEQKERNANRKDINLMNIVEMFNDVLAKGPSKPKVLFRALLFSVAPLHGKNAGWFYVKDAATKVYLGKISPTGEYRGKDQKRLAPIGELSKDELKEAMVSEGKTTKVCCFCATIIKTKASLDAGYGPICAEKYDLPWGEKA